MAGVAVMGARFTPGPWKVGTRPDGSMWLSLGNPMTGPHYQGDLCASKADARLIVHGREIYEALKSIVEAAEMHGTNGFEFFAARNQALEIIEKVEGRNA